MAQNYINYIETFYDKENYLKQYFEEISPMDFYRFIFPEGSFERKGHQEDVKPNGIVVAVSHNKTYKKFRRHVGEDGIRFDELPEVRRLMITDELTELDYIFSEVENDGPEALDFYTMPAVSYIGLKRTLDNARYLHALVLDIDGLSHVDYLHDLVYQFQQDITPTPTFIVNSGHGVHLYFVFENPIPLYPNYCKVLKELKYQLVRRIWNRYTSDDENKQFQSIIQPFRMVGTLNKDGQLIRAYQTGNRCTVYDLSRYFPDSPINTHGLDSPRKTTLHEAKQRWPEWYERKIAQGNKSANGRWIIKRDLYDWWLNRVRSDAVEGARYFAVMALAIYARKCNIPLEELEEDAYGLVKHLDRLTDKHGNFTNEDVAAALNAYQERYITFPRHDIEYKTRISMPENKRNGQRQADHLEEARAIRDIRTRRKGKSDWREGNGRPSAEATVQAWQEAHPGGKKADCIKATGLSKPTVYKWWKS